MKFTVVAVFEDGAFKPIEKPDILEGEHLQLTVEPVGQLGSGDKLELATRVYRELSPEEIDEIERIALDPSRTFTSARP